jgi:hypothetical protein
MPRNVACSARIGATQRPAETPRVHEWRAANREKLRQASQKWRTANLDKARQSTRAYREANPEKVRAQQRKYDAAKRARAKLRHPNATS